MTKDAYRSQGPSHQQYYWPFKTKSNASNAKLVWKSNPTVNGNGRGCWSVRMLLVPHLKHSFAVSPKRSSSLTQRKKQKENGAKTFWRIASRRITSDGLLSTKYDNERKEEKGKQSASNAFYNKPTIKQQN